LPLQTLVDGDENKKSLLQILIEQSLAAGAEEIAVVVFPGDEAPYAQAAGPHASSVQFVPQNEPYGYGHAIHCARSFLNNDPFLHMVGDHLYVNSARKPSALRLVELAEKEGCSVSGVQPTRESLLSHYGAVGGRRIPSRSGVYRVSTVIEKPTPTEAELKLLAPGIRAGYYLCYFGMHVFTPSVMEILDRKLAVVSSRTVTLVDVLAELAHQEQYLAIEDAGRRYDLGATYGLLIAQLAMALSGHDSGEVLSQIVELLADRELARIVDGPSK
jgi:UTP--glucose-1-phosphate uridylyltransferase